MIFQEIDAAFSRFARMPYGSMIAAVTQVQGRIVTFSAAGKSGIRTTFTSLLDGKKPPKAGDEGLIEVAAGGRRFRFVSNHNFYEFLDPRGDGSHRFAGSLPGEFEDVFIHAELGLARVGRREGRVAPIERAFGEVESLPGNRFVFRVLGEPDLVYSN